MRRSARSSVASRFEGSVSGTSGPNFRQLAPSPTVVNATSHEYLISLQKTRHFVITAHKNTIFSLLKPPEDPQQTFGQLLEAQKTGLKTRIERWNNPALKSMFSLESGLGDACHTPKHEQPDIRFRHFGSRLRPLEHRGSRSREIRRISSVSNRHWPQALAPSLR